MKKIVLFVIAFAFLCIGCATVRPLNTPTGKPEIIINDATKKEIADVVINQMLSWDFQLKTQSEAVLVFEKSDARVMSSVLFGSGYNGIPGWRFIYNVVDYSPGIRVVANIYAVTNPGSTFERVTDLSKGSQDANNVQSFFENMRRSFMTRAAIKDRGKIGIHFEKNIIKKVIENSPAEKTGLMVGDIILAVDHEPFGGNDPISDSMRLTGEPGSTVVLLIKRNDQEFSIPIIRGKP